MEHSDEPIVYPSADALALRIRDAVHICVRRNLIGPLLNEVETTVGAGNFQKVYKSIVYSPISYVHPLMHIRNIFSIQQLLGSLLHQGMALSTLEHSILESGPLVKSAAKVVRVDTGIREYIGVTYPIPYSAQLERYVRLILDGNVSIINRTENGMCEVYWDSGYVEAELSAIEYVADSIPDAIKVYYKLLTRFDKWATSQNTFPTFQR